MSGNIKTYALRSYGERRSQNGSPYGADMPLVPEQAGARVSAVIVSYNSGHALAGCLGGVSGVREVIVVDNNSADDSVEVARACGARVLSLRENVGFGRACNAGARIASGEFVLFVNPDAVATAEAVEALVAAADRYPEAGAFGPRIVHADGSTFSRCDSLISAPVPGASGRKRAFTGDCPVDMLLGAALFCRREVFLSLGGFDENIFLYYEDDDLCCRMRQAGWSLMHVHESIVQHGQGASCGHKPGLMYFSSFHWAVSKAYVARKHGVRLSPAKECLKSLLRGVLAALRFSTPRRERYFGLAAGYMSVLRSRRRDNTAS